MLGALRGADTLAESYYNINNVLVNTDDTYSPSDNLYRSWSYSQTISFYKMKTQFRYWLMLDGPNGLSFQCVHRDKVSCPNCNGTFLSPAFLPNILPPPPPPGVTVEDAWRTAQHKSKRYSTSNTVVNYTSVGGVASDDYSYGNQWTDYYGACPNYEG